MGGPSSHQAQPSGCDGSCGARDAGWEVREGHSLFDGVALVAARVAERRIDIRLETTVEDAAIAFNAMLEGLGNAELRGNVLRVLPEAGEEEAWRSALQTVVRGFTKTARAQRRSINSRARRSGRGKPAPSEPEEAS